MLLELRIFNFSLFDQLELKFVAGFIVFTGETGAGKSLLVDALALLLGHRAVGEQIRNGAEEAHLEAIFGVSSNQAVQDWLVNSGLAAPDSEELLIRRVLSRSGRNRAYVNGVATPVQQLQTLGRLLLDIHGQHDQQSVISSMVQLELVDAFGGLLPRQADFESDFKCWQKQQQELDVLREQLRNRIIRQEFLQYDYDELMNAHLEAGEHEALLLEYQRLQNSGRLSELSSQAYCLLYEQESSILSNLQSLKRVVQDLGTFDPNARLWHEVVEGVHAQMEDLAHSCRTYRDEIEHDPDRLGHIDERLALLQRLKKKYHESLDGLMKRRDVLKTELSEFVDLDHRLQNLEKRVAHASQEVREKAHTLSQARKKVAQDLDRRVMAELAALKMEYIQFQVQFSERSGETALCSTGKDRVDYLFCANPGEPLQPLGRVASGGELSRLMLAIKTVLADVDLVPVLVFDEIDTGIGGEVALVMGQRLRKLGESHQVLCLTHLPQIASQGVQHFVVEKIVNQHRTTVMVNPVHHAERSNEIARMLGGEQITPTVRKVATEMLQPTKPSSR